MLRRLHHEQPAGFAFSPANLDWARAQIRKYPEGREASAIIPLLWRAQEQEGWLTRPAIEHVADMLGMAYMRALEVASFYFMFQLQPVGSVAHVQVCGTLSCMICGAEDLMAVCKDKIAPRAHELSADGRFSWEEVECLGSCANAPMAQIGKDYYEDLTAEGLGGIIDALAAGQVPVPGPQNGRYAAEPKSGLTSLADHAAGRAQYNASVQLAVDIGDTVRRIDGTEVPLRTPWLSDHAAHSADAPAAQTATDSVEAPRPGKGRPADATGVTEQEAPAASRARPVSDLSPAAEVAIEDASDSAGTGQGGTPSAGAMPGRQPELLAAPREGRADDLTRVNGIGPTFAARLNQIGVYHLDQIAGWDDAQQAWIAARLNVKRRMDWVDKAASLLARDRGEG